MVLFNLILITFIIDFLISYNLSNLFNNLNYFYPMFIIVLIVYLYKRLDNKTYFKTIFIIGIVYDLLYSSIFLFNALIFLLMGKIIKRIDKYFRCNLIIYVILIIVFIFLYDLILFLLVYFTKINIVSFYDLWYKFSHSLIINISFYFLLLIVLKNVKLKK